MSFFAPFDAAPSLREPALDVVLRRVGEGDVEALVEIEGQVRGTEAQSLRDGFSRKLSKGNSAIFVAEYASILGYSEVAWLSDDGGQAPEGYYLVGCTVPSKWRRRGIGRLLTQIRLEWIAERSPKALYFANAQNLASLAMHQEFGFTEVARGPRFQRTEFTGGEGILLQTPLPNPNFLPSYPTE
ncbi:ribosomal protein S18 acetylase RimI-like enzyme [Psychromicrobium silvestre]|uniref:Ribosomal protein S18 acetylase RimI-like enzyme n=1 Tax=Psychromicrobium silvestre TaxID=1645614 RepID=A0A7Y9LSF3_9MICC|nr:GNAT family N-acetyltransferase [Psychromicrobium silvestre]NYE94754.1 ribosomal protein S18 acetylase RimI-like enzyme [Psychromicrobium silvestre]